VRNKKPAGAKWLPAAGVPFNECLEFGSGHRPSREGVMMPTMPGDGDDHKLRV